MSASARVPSHVVVAALLVPLLAAVVGLLAMPRPRGVDATQASFDRTTLRGAVSATAPHPSIDVVAQLGPAIRIVGAELPQQPLPRGAHLTGTIHFACAKAVDADWQVFVHVDSRALSWRLNVDHFPVKGRYPTTLWRPGEFIADAWDKIVPNDAPAGTYDVWVGLYRGDERIAVTGTAAGVHDGANRVRIGTIRVD